MKKSILFSIISFVFISVAIGQSDDCSTATVIVPEDGSCTSPGYSNTGFTGDVSDPTPSCWADTPDNSAWFQFVATAGQVSINTNFTTYPGDITDTQVALFEGACGAMTELACNEDILVSNPMAALQYYGLTIGNTYYILVDGYGGQTGDFNMCLENLADPTPPSAGQDCDSAAPLCDASTVSYTNVSAGGGTPEIPSCFSFGEGNSTWVTWVAETADPIVFDIVPNVSTDDYDFALYDLGASGDCLTKTELACNYDVPCTGGPPADRPYVGMAVNPATAPCPQQYETAVVPTIGNVYSILISNFSGSDGFNLVWSGSTAHAGPTASFTVSSNTVCAGEAVNFTNTSTGPNSMSYSWDFGDGSPNSSTTSPSYTYTAAGGYTATLTVIDDVIGCISTATDNITVNASPTAAFTHDGPACAGSTVSFTNTSAGGLTYEWDYTTDAVIDATTNNASTTFSPGGTYYTTLIATNGSGCTDTVFNSVTIYSLPTVSAGADQVECEGTTITLSGSGATSYAWDNGVSDGVGFVPAVGTVTYTVTGTDGNGCVNTDQADVTINANPTVDAGVDQTECEGTTITLSGSGATSYAWDNGVTDGVGFTPGVGTVTYTVTGTDGNGCTDTDVVDVTINANPTVDAGVDQTECEGTTITLSGSGATSYAWDNGVTDGVGFVPGVGTVTYTVIGTDGNGCTDTDVVDVTINANPTVDAGVDQTECEGTSITLSGSGATSYAWDNGVTDGVAFTPGVGTVTYTVTGTDGNGCTDTDVVDVTINANPNATITPPGAFCPADPAVNLTAADGGGTWAGTGITDVNLGTFDPSVAGNGTWTITYNITDGNGCSDSDSEDIVVNNSSDATITAAGPWCEDAGVQTLVAADGGGTWSGTGITDGANGYFDPATATAGTYTITYTIAGACGSSDTEDFTVWGLPTVSAGADQAECDGTSITLSGSGATSYSWDNGVTDAVAFTPGVGTVTYTVTGTDGNGCQNTDQVDVTIYALPTVDAGVDQTECEGTTITLSGAGATSYAWDNGVTDGVGFVPAAGTVTYTVTGTDGNGCVDTDQVDVTINALPAVDAGVDQTECEGTSITLSGSGATSYAWDNGVTDAVAFTPGVGTVTYTVTGTDGNGCVNTDQVDVTINANPTVDAGVDQTECDGTTITLSGSGATSYAWDNGVTDGVGFVPGVGTVTYTVTGTDGNGCTDTDQVDVTINANPTVDAGVDQTECDGTAITLSGSGATSYAWDNGVTDGVAFTPAAGTVTYTVTGTDGNGCTDTDQVDVTINALPAVDAGLDQAVCDGTDVTLSGAGATTYAWDNGVTDGVAFSQAIGMVTYTVTGTDGNGCVNTDQVDVTVNANPVATITPPGAFCPSDPAMNLTAATGGGTWSGTGITDVNLGTFDPSVAGNGMWTITYIITDGNGCTDTDTEDINVNNSSDATITAAGPWCEDNGTVTLMAANGGGTWSGTGIVDGSNGTFDPSVATGGTYTITYTIGGACGDTDTEDFTVWSLPTVDAGIDQAVCDGANVTLSGAGATSYTWDNGVTDAVAFTPSVGTVTYTVTGTDGNGCVNTDQVDVTVNALPTVDAGVDQIECEGTSITLSGSGATTYSWDNGVTDGVAFTPGIGTVTYTVTGTDGNSCQNTDQVDVTINSNPIVNAGLDQEVCEGTSVLVAGAGAVSYSWDNGVTDGVGFTPAVGTITYTVIGTDANGCTDTDDLDITVNAMPVVDAGLDQEVCEGVSITLSGSGAVTYTWDNGVSDGNPFTQPIGTTTYNVTGTDANGCTDTDQVDVLVNANPDATITSLSPMCLNDGTVNLTAATNGGLWSGVGITDVNAGTFDPLVTGAGTFTMTYDITDANGCSSSDTEDFTVNGLPDATINSMAPLCANDAAVLMSGVTAGGTWSGTGITDGSAGSFDPSVSGVGTFDITYLVTDVNGCSDSDMEQVDVLDLPDATFTSGTPYCSGDAASFLTPTTAGGTFSGTGIVDANLGSFDPAVAGLGDVVLTYTVTNGLGCTDSFNHTATVNETPAQPTTSDFEKCENDDSAIVLSATGTDMINWYEDVTVTDLLETGDTFTPAIKDPGLYTYYVTASNSSCSSEPVPVDVEIFTVDAAFITDVSEGDSPLPVQFTDLSTNIASYEWYFGTGDMSTESDPLYTYTEGGEYEPRLIVVTNDGCIDTVKSLVIVNDISFMDIPNIFTPNGDGMNDHFNFDSDHLTQIKCEVFNRWGNLIYSWDSPRGGWDGYTLGGSEAPDGTYFYVIEALGTDGTIYKHKGSVTLLR